MFHESKDDKPLEIKKKNKQTLKTWKYLHQDYLSSMNWPSQNPLQLQKLTSLDQPAAFELRCVSLKGNFKS